MNETVKNPKEQTGKNTVDSAVKKNESRDKIPDGVAAGKSQADIKARDEVIGLLGNDDIETALKKFKADSSEKEIARDFTNSHIQFLYQIVENDYKRGVARNDAEIRDLLSNVNMMLMKKDEYLFTTIIMHCPSHYRLTQKRFYEKMKKDEEKKEKK